MVSRLAARGLNHAAPDCSGRALASFPETVRRTTTAPTIVAAWWEFRCAAGSQEPARVPRGGKVGTAALGRQPPLASRRRRLAETRLLAGPRLRRLSGLRDGRLVLFLRWAPHPSGPGAGGGGRPQWAPRLRLRRSQPSGSSPSLPHVRVVGDPREPHSQQGQATRGAAPGDGCRASPSQEWPLGDISPRVKLHRNAIFSLGLPFLGRRQGILARTLTAAKTENVADVLK